MKNGLLIILRLLVVFALVCNVSGAFAATETINGNYILTSDKSVGNNDTLIINGNLNIPDNKKLTINNNAVLRVKGNLTVAARGTLELKNNSRLYVSGDLIQDGTSPLGWGILWVTVGDVTNGNNTFIVVEGDYTIWGNDGDGKTGYLDPSKSTIYVFGDNDLNKVYNSSTVDKVKDQDDFFNEQHASSISEFLPIELTSFTATATDYGITFKWVTASEVENDYFTLEFSENGEDFIAIDYVHGAGTTSETSEYEYVWDAKPTADILYFRLKQTDYNGEFTYSDILVFAPKNSHGATRTLYYGPLKLNVVDGQLRYIENK
ncbi:MAG: hypothetical protein J6W37_02730 [Bacteroidales bacterium]|nr:hypothetical protein [Bacteroidales bacterium]